MHLRPDTVLIEESKDAPAGIIGILEASSSDVKVIRLSLTEN